MKQTLKLFTLGLIALLAACSSNDECAQEDWVGTYRLTSEAECIVDENTTLEFDDTIVITAGATDNQIIIDGEELTIVECSTSFLFSTLSLNGDDLTITAGTCSGEYERN